MRVLFCTDTYLPQIERRLGRDGGSEVEGLRASRMVVRGGSAPRYPASDSTQARARTYLPERCTSFASLPMPYYPEVRLARTAGYREPGRADRRFSSRPGALQDEVRHRPRRASGAAARAGFRWSPPITPTSPGTPRRTGAGWLKRAGRRGYLRGSTAGAGGCTRRRAVAQGPARALGVERSGGLGPRGGHASASTPGRRSQELRAALGMGSRFTFLLRRAARAGEARRRR